MNKPLWTLPLLALGCGGDMMTAPDWVANFNPPEPQAGYTRFVTPTVKDIKPGDDVEWCQWVADPTAAQDVLDFGGVQSPTGHHAVLYATTETNFKVGESHICTDDDMLSISFVGAIGGEGNAGSASKLPDGLYYRVPAGQALMVNTHWLNATDNAVDGQAVIDVKFAPASDTRQTADIFVNNALSFSLPPNAPSTYDVSCTLKEDLSFAMSANHMHGNGTTAYTELVHTDGTKQMIVDDTAWPSDAQFNPHMVRWGITNPIVAHVGDTVHTHCEWTNQTNKTILFPTEMCVGINFYFPAHGQIACNDGSWPTN